MIDTEAIVARAKLAFPTDPVPPAEELRNDHCEECADVSTSFGVRPWTAVALADIVGKETALLNETAWRYFLPAVISWCVQNADALDTLPEYTVYQLAPPKDGETDEWFETRKDGFTEAQRGVIVAYLEWYRDREEAEYRMLEMAPPEDVYRALEYWRAKP